MILLLVWTLVQRSLPGNTVTTTGWQTWWQTATQLSPNKVSTFIFPTLSLMQSLQCSLLLLFCLVLSLMQSLQCSLALVLSCSVLNAVTTMFSLALAFSRVHSSLLIYRSCGVTFWPQWRSSVHQSIMPQCRLTLVSCCQCCPICRYVVIHPLYTVLRPIGRVALLTLIMWAISQAFFVSKHLLINCCVYDFV